MTAVGGLGLALGVAWAIVVAHAASALMRRRLRRRPGLPATIRSDATARPAGDAVTGAPTRHDRGPGTTDTGRWGPDCAGPADLGRRRWPGSGVDARGGPGRPSASPGRGSPVVALGAALRRLGGLTVSRVSAEPTLPTAEWARSSATTTSTAEQAQADLATPTATWARATTPTAARAGAAAAAGTHRRGARAPARGPAIAPPAEPASCGADDEIAADRRTGWAALAGGGLLMVAPALAAAPLGWAMVAPVVAARRDRARHEAQLHDQLPDVVDLLALTTAAGLPVSAALTAIDDRPGGPLGAALARAAAHLRHGGSTSEALIVLGAVGPPVRPLVDALVQHDRYGTALLPALERVAIEARSRRRRRAEEVARRLPVTLLFPLVLTTFPAFILLTVVPLLAGSFGSLSLSPT